MDILADHGQNGLVRVRPGMGGVMKIFYVLAVATAAMHLSPASAQTAAPSAGAVDPCGPGTDRGAALPTRLQALRDWVKANPRDVCAAKARAMLEVREAKIRAFAEQPTAGAQPATFTQRLQWHDLGWAGPLLDHDINILVRLYVEADGKAEHCEIVESGGTTLDHGLCRRYMAISRLLPARDARGAPIASTVDQRITYRAGG